MPNHQQQISSAIESLQRLSDLFCERREQLAREAGLTVQQWCVLEKISEKHFMPSMFARHRDSSAAAVSKVIRQLLDKGVIQVGVQEHDGRQRRYTLTAAGESIVEQLRASRQRAIDSIWSGLDPRELEQFTSFSEQLGDRLSDYIQQQKHGAPAVVLEMEAPAPPEPVFASLQPVPTHAVITSTNKFID